jgi:hypothetical protein
MTIRQHPDAVAFKEAATRYCSLLEQRPQDPDQWVGDVLGALASLYACGCALPDFDLPEHAPDVEDISAENVQRVASLVNEVLGWQTGYWSYFDPSEPPNSEQEPCFGCLWDDLADIYRDVKPGVLAWESGLDAYLPSIVFDWKHPLFSSHWGLHAVSAMRALHPIAYLRGVQRRA